MSTRGLLIRIGAKTVLMTWSIARKLCTGDFGVEEVKGVWGRIGDERYGVTMGVV